MYSLYSHVVFAPIVRITVMVRSRVGANVSVRCTCSDGLKITVRSWVRLKKYRLQQ